jgi:thioredoxin-like negative regulator of GroEL
MGNAAHELPRLVFFYSGVSGRCRRVEGFLAQVLQRRHNHETFRLHRVEEEDHPELFARFKVTEVPTLAVVEGKKLCSRLVKPRSCREIEHFLAPWLK